MHASFGTPGDARHAMHGDGGPFGAVDQRVVAAVAP
jgi:hypothetical protein